MPLLSYARFPALLLSVGITTVARAQTGSAFGDSASYGVRILQLDRVHERAVITARNPKNLIVLAVVPGREIEIIRPGNFPIRREHEKDTYSIDMRRLSDEAGPSDAGQNASARLAYDRCMRNARARADQIAQQKARSVRRDSTGKVIGGGSTGDVGADLHSFQIACDRLAQESAKRREPTFAAAREPADRYLVVLSSASRLSQTDLYERLATLTAIAPDVATTIEAIAAGLYVGVTGTYGGYFVAW